MRLLYFAFVLLCFRTAATGQTVTQTPAKVTDFGQLYSTFNWEQRTITELNAALGSAWAAKVVAASVESAWPSGIATLQGRTDNRPLMATYKLYYLTTIDGSRAVLMAPAAENKHMPANMQPRSDIYFLVTESSVEREEVEVPVKPSPAKPAVIGKTTDFQEQMNVIVDDYANAFTNLIGKQIDQDEDGLLIQYDSKVIVDDGIGFFFIEDLLNSSVSFHAEYSGSPDPKKALRIYLTLISKIQALKLTACKLSKSVEVVDGNIRSQVFQAYDPAGNLPAAYEQMNVEVRIIQGETTDKNGQSVIDWYVMLEVYER